MASSAGRGAAGRFAVERFTPKVMSQDMRIPFASLLTQTFGKPVELNLTQLSKPHLDSSILASVAAEHMRDRRTDTRTVFKALVDNVALPPADEFESNAAVEARTTRALRSRPQLKTVGMKRTNISSVLEHLRLKRVSSIMMRIGGRYGKRLTADMATADTTRRGLTGKQAGFLVRNVRPHHLSHADKAGKRKVGAYGVRVRTGHS